jgi:hypothetical protein
MFFCFGNKSTFAPPSPIKPFMQMNPPGNQAVSTGNVEHRTACLSGRCPVPAHGCLDLRRQPCGLLPTALSRGNTQIAPGSAPRRESRHVQPSSFRFGAFLETGSSKSPRLKHATNLSRVCKGAYRSKKHCYQWGSSEILCSKIWNHFQPDQPSRNALGF